MVKNLIHKFNKVKAFSFNYLGHPNFEYRKVSVSSTSWLVAPLKSSEIE
jgi:hypothetical protein